MLACPKCSQSGLADLKSYVAHIAAVHSHEPNFSIHCNLQKGTGNCCVAFKSLASYKTHLYRFHADIKVSSTEIEVICSVCGTGHNSLRALSVHYAKHCNEGMGVHCVVKHCNSVFEIHSSYRSHMSRSHKNVTLSHIKDAFIRHEPAIISNDNSAIFAKCDNTAPPEVSKPELFDINMFTRNIALLFLKMKTEYSLPEATVQNVIDDFAQVIDVCMVSVQQQVAAVGRRHNASDGMMNDISGVFENTCWNQAHAKLSTAWRRNSYWREHFTYIEPVEYKFEDNVMCTDKFQYVSLIESVKAILKNESVRAQITKGTNSVEGHLSTLRDGLKHKQNRVFSAKNTAVQVILYSDEFEVVNPLGPHKRKHKMFAVYFTLGNFDNEIKSKKSAVFLLALCKSVSIKKYGFKYLTDIINQDITILESEGISIDGYTDKVFGAVAFIAGDNLNSNMIGGFNSSFSPNVSHPCRYCMVSNVELQIIDSVDKIENRTVESYEKQASEVLEDPTVAQMYGVRNKSPFIHGTYHVVDGLPPDIMHDLLEGVVPFELALVIKCLIDQRFFTLDELNGIISDWNYGPQDKANKPVILALNFGECVKQNAGRMWCLLRLLPVMIGGKIPQGNKYWNFILQLKDIVELCFAQQLAVGHVQFLQNKIQDHLATFHELFPNNMLKPKQHFLLHYPRMFMLYGPLRLCWCMRFESKHFFFTHLMTVVSNYKNATSTLAQRHQWKLAFLLADRSNFLGNSPSFSATETVDLNFLSDVISDAIASSNISTNKPIHRCKFAAITGITYHCGMFVVIDVDMDSDLPVFGHIDSIYVQDMTCYFQLTKYSSLLDEHLSAYRIIASEDVCVLKVEQFVDYLPLTAYWVQTERYIVLQNFVYNHDLFTY